MLPFRSIVVHIYTQVTQLVPHRDDHSRHEEESAYKPIAQCNTLTIRNLLIMANGYCLKAQRLKNKD